jgi:hypothetical protein
MAPEEKLSVVVSVRFTQREIDGFHEVAEGRKLSHVVRELALAGLKPGSTANPVRYPVRTTSAPGNVPLVYTTDPRISAPRPRRIVIG